MSYQRLYYSREELARQAPARLSWPAVSIGFLCFFALVAPPGFITAINLYLLLLVGIVWAAGQRAVERPLVLVTLPFGLMMVIGLVLGAGADRYLYLKDAWYYSNPAVIIALGFVFGRLLGDSRRGLRAFILAGTLVALVHMVPFMLRPELLLRAATSIRAAAGTGYYATALAIIILLGWRGRWRESLGLHPVVGTVCLLLCTASFVLSFSRTMTLVVVVGALAMVGVFARREWLRIAALALVGVLAIVALQATVDTSSIDSRRSFIGKLARSFEEISVQDYSSAAQINSNWRGYETARGLDHWQEGAPAQWLLGSGFGAQVDLGRFQNLSNDPRAAVRFIPIFHNGYVYLLVKTGLVGVALYVAVLIWLYRVGRRTAANLPVDEAALEGRALQACAVVMLLSTWVVAGAFNKFDMFAFLMMIGFLLARRTVPANTGGRSPKGVR